MVLFYRDGNWLFGRLPPGIEKVKGVFLRVVRVAGDARRKAHAGPGGKLSPTLSCRLTKTEFCGILDPMAVKRIL